MPRFHFTAPVADVPDFEAYNHGRTFRDVLEAVQNGMEELGEACKPSDFDFKSIDDVDMEVPTTTFVEKLDVGCEMSTKGDFEDRLADRLGLKQEKSDPAE